jgi:glucan biosynthesis protein
VAFWVPQTLPDLGQPVNYSYTLTWSSWSPDDKLPPAGYVSATRTAAGRQEHSRKFIVDFKGGDLDNLKGNTPIQAEASVGQGARLLERSMRTRTALAAGFTILPDDQVALQRVLLQPPPITCALPQAGTDALTETLATLPAKEYSEVQGQGVPVPGGGGPGQSRAQPPAAARSVPPAGGPARFMAYVPAAGVPPPASL